MALSLTNLAKSLGPDLLKIAEKLKARECEETEVGHFVAFVEEGKNDFDVSVILTPKGLITSHSCDCGEKVPVCRHKVALLLFLAGGRKSKSAAAPKKKESVAEVLLREAEPNALKTWLLEMFTKNKDLELLFTSRFKSTGTEATPESIMEATILAAKSLIKNKKKLEQLEVKKIIELWEEIHKPIVNQYLENASSASSFRLFHSVLKAVLETTQSWHTTGNKVKKYIENLLKASVEAILALHQPAPRQKAFLFFVEEIGKADSPLRYWYLDEILQKLSVLEVDTQKVLIHRLMDATNRLQKNKYSYQDILVVKMLMVISAYDMFAEYNGSFDYIVYKNEYNQLLVNELIQIKKLDRAEQICIQAIESNYQDAYSLPYYDLLKEIYKASGNQKGVRELAEKTLSVTFDFADYKMVYEAIPEGEAKVKLRNRLFTKARSTYTEESENFIFELIAYEGKYKKMIEYIRSATPVQMITKFMEPMAKTGKFELLKAIFERDKERCSSYRYEEEDAQLYPEITRALLICYDPEELRLGISSHKNSRLHGFNSRSILADYLKNELKL